MAFFEFPHTRTYDSDLGWLIKRVKEQQTQMDGQAVYMEELKAWMDENEPRIEDIERVYDEFESGQLPAEVVTALENWLTQYGVLAHANQYTDAKALVLQGNINSEADTRAAEDTVLQAQIDQLIAPTGTAPSQAEIENARIGADGTIYTTLGEAIRTQVGDITEEIGDFIHKQTAAARLMDINVALEPGDVFYCKPITWTGAAFTGIQVLGYRNGNWQAFYTLQNLGDERFFQTGVAFEKLRVSVGVPTVPATPETLEVILTNIGNPESIAQFALATKYDNTKNVQGTVSFTTSTLTAPYDDLDTAPVNRIFAYTGTAAAALANTPMKSWITVMTFNYQVIGNLASTVQIVEEVRTGIMYVRSYTGSWTEWRPINAPLYVNSSGWHGNYKAYTTFKAGVEAAVALGNCTLHVDNGTYDILSEFGSTYIENYAQTAACGCELGNNVTVEFAAGAKVTANYTGNNALIKQYFSPLNIISSFRLVNANIEVENVRYCVHEDIGTIATPPDSYEGEYIDCIMLHNGNNLPNWYGTFCIGLGAQPGSRTKIVRGSYTANNTRHVPIFAHNSSSNTGDSYLDICGVILGASDHFHFRRADAAGNTVNVNISGCYMGAAITYADGAPDKFNMTIWNNTMR